MQREFDRRHCRRIRKFLPVTLRVADETFPAVTIDISRDGAFLNTAASPPPATVVRVVRCVHGRPLEATARVVRVVDQHSRVSATPGVGVRWMRFAAQRLTTLRRFLRDTLELPPGEIDPSSLRTTGAGVAYYVTPPAVYGLAGGAVLQARLRREGALPVRAAHDPRTERRAGVRVNVHTDAVYCIDGLPSYGKVLNVSSTGVYVSTHEALPPLDAPVVVRTHMTGDYAAYWVQLRGRVARYWHPPDPRAAGFAVAVDEVREAGPPGSFHQWLSYLRGLQRVAFVPPAGGRR